MFECFEYKLMNCFLVCRRHQVDASLRDDDHGNMQFKEVLVGM